MTRRTAGTHRLRVRGGDGRTTARAGPGDVEARLGELGRSRGALRRVLAGLAAALVARGSGGQAGGGWERLGYVRAGDWARERLGLSGRSLHDLARVGRALDGLPGLEAALVTGALPWSKVRLLARFVGPDDEGRWIARARGLTVRELERRVRAVDRGALGAGAPDADDEEGARVEPLETVRLRVGSALYFKWQRTRAWAARVAGEPTPPGTVLEMVTAEALSALACEVEPGVPTDVAPTAALREAEVAAQRSTPGAANVCAGHDAAPDAPGLDAAWDAPGRHATLPAFLAPLLEGLDRIDVFELDARLRRAVRLEQRLDAEIAPLLRVVTSSEFVWRERPHTLASFARERLGMSPRKARALLRLERVGQLCPELRAAWRDGALSWVQAQALAPLLLVDVEGPWRRAWVRFASRVTVRRLEQVVGRALTLREADPRHWLECRDAPERADALERRACERAIDAADDDLRQTCARPRGLLEGIGLRVTAPREVVRLFRGALCSLRRAIEEETGRLPAEDEAFEAMIEHALRTWGVDDPWLRGHARAGRRFSVFERDGWRCTIPGCTSRRNLHAHHVRFRSAGGGDEEANLTTLCAAHHHRGVHAGRVRVGGRAPAGLWFELGVREGRPPLVRYHSGDRVV